MGKHYVPQRYLEGFSTAWDAKQIWMFDKLTGGWSEAAIKRVAQQRDYFPPDVELRLKRLVEDPGNGALRLLRDGHLLDGREVENLVVYLAVMIMRVPRKRRLGREQFPSVMQETFASIRHEIADLRAAADEGAVERLLAELLRLEAKYVSEIPEQVQLEIENPWPSSRMIEAIRRMCWRCVRAPRDFFFFTTDNPAFFFSAYGVGSTESELTFPVCSHTALIGSFQGPSGTMQLVSPPVSHAKEINRRLASGADRFVYSPRKAVWIETLAKRREPSLSRIIWGGR
jgi:hypothetical protein